MLPSNLPLPVTEQRRLVRELKCSVSLVCPSVRLPACLPAQGVEDWEVVLHKAKGMFLKCPPRELILKAPAYIKETLGAGG